MPKFLFWNLGGRTIVPLVRLAAAINRVDILILAEVSLPPASVEEQLNIDSAEFRYAGGNYQRVHFYCRFDNRFLTLLSETDKYSIRRLRLPARKELLLVGAHLPSLMAVSATHIAEECRFLSAEIQRIESVENHRRTVLMGDLNLNPFDSVLVQTTGLHAVASRITALRNTRTVQNRSFPFFYNPMWGYLGDRHSDSAGTFYYGSSEHLAYFWNTFDQVLLRPELVEDFSHDQVQVLTRIGSIDLVKGNGRPDGSVGSDHLPVTLELNF